MEPSASTPRVTAVRLLQQEQGWKDQRISEESVREREAEDAGSEEASAEEGSFAFVKEVWAFRRTGNLIGEPQLSMALMNGDAKMQDDAETEQEAGICARIARKGGKEEGLEHGGSEFDAKEGEGSAIAAGMQEASTWDGDGEADQPRLLPYDFFAAGETSQLASYLHRQTEEIGERLRRSSHLHQPGKPSNSCRTEPSFIQDEGSIGCDFFTIPPQSKVASTSPQLLPGQLDLSLKPPLCLGAAADSNNHRNSSESVVGSKWNSLFGPLDSQEISRIVSRPCSTTPSAEFSGCHDNIMGGLHSSPEQSENSEPANGCGNSGQQQDEHQAGGTSHGIGRSFSTSNHSLASIPGALSLALSPQEACAMRIDSHVEHAYVRSQAQMREHVPLQLVPPSTSCVDSSEWDNFGADITTGIAAAKESSLRHGRSRHRSEEIDAMSEAGGLDESKEEEEGIVALGVDTAEAPTEVKDEGCGALDLLLTAIQVTSGGMFGIEDHVQGPVHVFESVIEAGDHVHPCSKEVIFLSRGARIVKKRVIRRARSAFKKLPGQNSMRNAARALEVPDVIVQVPFGRRKRKMPSGEQDHDEDMENDCNLHFSEVLQMKGGRIQVKDGDPLVRSKRGRSQVLPTRFSDSVLQPWKRKSRRKHNGKFHIP